MRERFGDGLQTAVTQSLDVHDLVWRKALIRPELRPQRRFLVRGLDAVREKDGGFAGENGLARNRCE